MTERVYKHARNWLTALAAATLVVGSGIASASTENLTTTASPGEGAKTFTLLTGDRLVVRTLPDGAFGVQVRPGEGRAGRISFSQHKIRDHHYVIPSDAAGAIAKGNVDKQLFDLNVLASNGIDDRTTKTLPLLVEYGKSRSALRGTFASADTKVTRELPVVDAVAVRQPKQNAGTLWRTIGNARTANASKIWLDGGIRPQLDQSVPQVGAPEAWRAGYTGKGVKVGVLDSGYDDTHPDLEGQVAASKDFVTTDKAVAATAGDVNDPVGHGTHVASTIAGTGAASNGEFKGVARDAELLVARVCGPFGCAFSDIIAGMEWTAAQGAKVVNVSLGGGPSDGTDPLSQAVNEITARTGTLFVISAGNAGQYGEETVSTPGSADSALTVGSVTKSDTLSVFSSIGPRFGDGALKPDLTAPGDRIVAARAKGTLEGLDVSEHYAELSGTSMAAPHVAGAAAILAQKHPTWKANELKAALMGSAKKNGELSVYQQGAGRLDVARAAKQNVSAFPGSLSLGTTTWPHHDDKPISKKITYTNDSDRPITLNVDVDVRQAPRGMFSTSKRRLTIPAHGKADLTVTADTRVGGRDGRYGGWLVATGKGNSIRTPIGIVKEVRHHQLDLTILDREGKPAGVDPDGYPLSGAFLADLDTGRFLFWESENGTGTLRVPQGRYAIDAYSSSSRPDASRLDVTLFAEPDVHLDRARAFTFDARKGKLLDASKPRPDAFKTLQLMGFVRTLNKNLGAYYATYGVVSDPSQGDSKVYAVPTKRFDERKFVAVANIFWAKPGPQEQGTFWENSPFLYDQVKTWPGQVPSSLTIATKDKDFTKVNATYAASDSDKYALKWFYPLLKLPNGKTTHLFVFVPAVGMSLPFQREEYYSSDEGVRWLFTLEQYSDSFYNDLDTQVRTPVVDYRGKREVNERWNNGVVGPAFADPVKRGDAGGLVSATPFAFRDGDSFDLFLPMFGDGNPERYGTGRVESWHTALYGDGKLVHETNAPYGQVFRVPTKPTTYRLESTVDRGTLAKHSTKIASVWTFRSRHNTPGTARALPLQSVRFTPRLDERNQGAPGEWTTIPVTVQRQAGSGHAVPTSLTVEISYDDGKSWTRVRTARKSATTWNASVRNPDSGTVSFRAQARDSAGSTVKQTIVRAYSIKE